MAIQSRHTGKPSFLPSGAGDFLRLRILETCAIALMLFSVVLAVCLAGFHPADPSLNTSNPETIRNPVGWGGAMIADLVLQSLGLAGALLVFVFFAWGWRLFKNKRLDNAWIGLTLLPISLLLFSIVFAGLPATGFWPLDSGLGGFAGQLILLQLSDFLTRFSLDIAPLYISLGALVPAFIVLAFALGLNRNEWGALYLHMVGFVRFVWSLAAGTGRFVRAMVMTLGAFFLGRKSVPLPSSSSPARSEPTLNKTAAKSSSAPGRAAEGLVARRSQKIRPGKRAASDRQARLDLNEHAHYAAPALDLLDMTDEAIADQSIDKDSLQQNARLLETVLDDFGVRGDIVKVRPGPIVTLYELSPAPGTKTSRVIGLADDISRSMSAISARIAAIPGRNVIGIELPNARRETVLLRELLSSDIYERSTNQLPIALGKDIGGVPVIADLARMPHLLVAGTTGSGKSVAINAMILSLLYRLPPDVCKLILIDPKMLELSVYDDIPHLLSPVVTDPKKAVVALKWAVREMENRYRLMSKMGVRNISGYNERVAKARNKGEVLTRKVQTGFDGETGNPVFEEQPLDLDPMPLIVVVVDEMADLMLVAGKDIEAAIQRLSQMARAAGIHLIMATQRPSVDVITGTIKANFPTRISFQVTSKIDSRTILGDQGAEQLLGQGDMLFMAAGGRVTRVHGPLVRDEEVEAVVEYLRTQGEPSYLESVTQETDDALFADENGSGPSGDALYDQAVALVCRERKASTSFVQRHLQIGYNRAARIIEQMEQAGVIGQANHVGKREVLAGDIEG